MMEAASERLVRRSTRPRLVAVTILTSLSAEDLAEVGYRGEPEENVLRLAALAKRAGMDGVVCSPREAALLRERLDRAFLLVTPGVRPQQATMDDQRRVMTPVEAIRAGADYLVIGRPITAATQPLAVLEGINREIHALDQSA